MISITDKRTDLHVDFSGVYDHHEEPYRGAHSNIMAPKRRSIYEFLDSIQDKEFEVRLIQQLRDNIANTSLDPSVRELTKITLAILGHTPPAVQ